MDRTAFKKLLLEHCFTHVDKKENQLRTRQKVLREALMDETKSTAGDKHETGRAMVQLEQEKLGAQQLELKLVKETLQKVVLEKPRERVSLGSLVKTKDHYYFLAISAGVFEQGATQVFCISAASPIGRHMMGRKRGERFVFRKSTIHILEIE
nr:3-oxoacyl-ACP synthase [uncultured Allomuricauda sp.]